MIRPVTVMDADAVCEIYNHYVRETCVTFEEEPVTAEQMRVRITETVVSHPWFVWDEAGTVLGYAYATKWKNRSAYRFSAESTIYLRKDAAGRGIGTQLYAHLVREVEQRGIHSLIGGIALPNAASQRLHEKLGFKPVAHFLQVGWKFGRWIDVGYWELTFPVPADRPTSDNHPPKP